MEWSEEQRLLLDRIKASMVHSTAPYLFPSPRDVGFHVLEEPLAEFRYALHDVVSLIPDRDERQPDLGDVLKSVVLDLAIDYPQYKPEGLETMVYLGYGFVSRNYQSGPVELKESREVSRKEVSRRRISNEEIEIQYEIEYLLTGSATASLAKPILQVIREFYPALLAVPELQDASTRERSALFLDLWSRLGSVPKSGSSRTRATLLLFASNFETYAKHTVIASLGTRAINLPDSEIEASMRDITKGKSSFAWYRRWLDEKLGDDILKPLHEVFVRRNQFAHHGGTAQQSYVNQFPEFGIKVGRPIPLTREYLLGITDTGAEVAGRLTQLLRERNPSRG